MISCLRASHPSHLFHDRPPPSLVLFAIVVVVVVFPGHNPPPPFGRRPPRSTASAADPADPATTGPPSPALFQPLECVVEAVEQGFDDRGQAVAVGVSRQRLSLLRELLVFGVHARLEPGQFRGRAGVQPGAVEAGVEVPAMSQQTHVRR